MWQKIRHHSWVSLLSLVSLIVVAVGWVWAYLTLRSISQPLILHFNSQEGITQTGSLRNMAAIGVLGIVIVIVNFFIGIELDEQDRFWGKLTAAATLVLALLIFIAFAAIINAN